MHTDRVVVITGAAGGMGEVLVDRFLANGDTVIATDTRPETLAKLTENHASDAKLVTVAADITKEEDCARVADAARDQVGRVDVLVNCAGSFPFVTFEAMTLEQWRQTIDINLTGNFLMTHAMLPLMKSRGWGRIINYGSGSVFNGAAGQAHYVAARAGIIGLTRSLARELGGYGITVNIAVPGVTMTEPVRRTLPPALIEQQRNARHKARRTSQRPGRPSVLSGIAGHRFHDGPEDQRRRRQQQVLGPARALDRLVDSRDPRRRIHLKT